MTGPGAIDTSVTAVLVAAAADEENAPEDYAGGGTDFGLLALFVVILTAVAISNIWLRRRAIRAKTQTDEPDRS